jgi:hypothetical protein
MGFVEYPSLLSILRRTSYLATKSSKQLHQNEPLVTSEARSTEMIKYSESIGVEGIEPCIRIMDIKTKTSKSI